MSTIQTVEYRVTVRVPDEPLLDETDQLVLERTLLAAVEARKWRLDVTVERE